MYRLARWLSSYTGMNSCKVLHNTSGREFYITLGIEKAKLQYEHVGTNTLNLYHTEVPVQLRGQGIAGYLAKAALDFAVEKDFKVKLTCSYLQTYVEKHPTPEYNKRIVPH